MIQRGFYMIYWLLFVPSVSSSDVECKKPCYCNPKTQMAACNSRHLRYIPRLPSYVRKIKFVENNFTVLNRTFFKNLTSFNDIELLNFTDNLIHHITEDAFQDFHNLSTMEISKESSLNITSLKKSLGSLNVQTLQSLYFSKNQWKNLSLDMFEELKDSRVSTLILTSNVLKNLNGIVFSHLKFLKILNLQNNLIEEVDLAGLEALEQLILIRNSISKIPVWCNKLSGKSLVPNLRLIRLDSNSITEMNNSSFRCLSNLSELRLDYNNFRFLQNNIFSEMEKLEKLYLSHNARLETIQESAFNVSSLQSLYFQYNNFHFDKQNEFNPKTLFTYCPNLKTLDMTSNFLPSLRKSEILRLMLFPLRKLQKLTLPYTRIRSLPLDLFPRFEFLKTLNLQGNSITGWNDSYRIFGNKSVLETLNLQANNIRLINATSFPQSLLASLKYLDISDNYFSCTCEQMWFRNWIRENIESKNSKTKLSLNGYPSHYKCMFPGELKGVLLQNYNPTEELCREKNLLLIIALPLTVVTIVAIFTVLVLYRCQTNIKNYIYLYRFYRSRKSGYIRLDSDEDYEYHAFIVYCDADREWVHSVCVKRLENDENMKVCIHHRDFDIGAPVTGNIGKYMGKCRKIVVIMSNNFAESEWCQWEVDLVQERRRRQGKDVALLVMLKTIDSRHMTSSLRTLLDSTPHLQYCAGFGERFFWKALTEQLRKPLGHPPYAVTL